LKVLGSNLWFETFFINYLQPIGWWTHMVVGGVVGSTRKI
jgi:hypothetical protein